MRYARSISVLVMAAVSVSAAEAATPALLELKTADAVFQGKLLVRSSRTCWLMDRDGELKAVDLKDVKSFRTIAPQFHSFTPGDMRNELQREFGKEFEIAGTRHYLVCATSGQARNYAEVFEELYRTFHLYFAVRGFTIREPEFPLVAIVFPDQKQFADYCRRDGMPPSPGLLGYYLTRSNRVALFNPDRKSDDRGDLGDGLRLGDRQFGTVQGSLQDTIIHEATHQVAFNTGLHSRLGSNPKWVVEGLATVFEAEGIRDSSKNRSVSSRLNRERYLWFGNFTKARRQQKSLADFVANDRMFETATLDAYSQAWALTFYLIETRPREYAGYLKGIAEHDPLRDYPKDERLADFKKAFGEHLELLEADFLRHLERVK